MNLVPAHADVLWTPATRLTDEDRAMHQQTFKELHALNAQLNGAGIAFPQIGLGLCAFVSRYEQWPNVINPEFRIVGGEYMSRLEGCLSKPGWHTYVRRPANVYAEWRDHDGFRRTAFLDGIEARVFQHLHDLCNGQPIFPRPKAPILTP